MARQKPDIRRVMELHSLLLKFQAVERVSHIPGNFRAENDTEHSYNLAMTAWFLAPFFPHLDADLIIRYALVHDMVEVHAGDTYIYADAATIASKKDREHAALKKLEKDWPDFPALTDTIHDYETHSTEEAKFVYALDKIMPIILIFLAEGHTWQKEGITLEQLHETKQPKVALSPEIDAYYQELYALLVEHHHYFTGQAGQPPHKT